MQQGQVRTMVTRRCSDDGAPQRLELLSARARPQEDAAIGQFLGFPEVHREAEWLQLFESQRKFACVRDFVIAAEGDMRRDQRMLHGIESKANPLDGGALRIWNKQAELTTSGLGCGCSGHPAPGVIDEPMQQGTGMARIANGSGVNVSNEPRC
jgi:hypothetical protein